MPHVDCYPSSANLVKGGGGDGEATKHVDTQGVERGNWAALSSGWGLGAPPDVRRIYPGDGLSPQACAAGVASAVRAAAAAPRKRIYNEAVRQALGLLWEAADRICGKRLKALLPVLIESMERHGHLRLDPVVRSALLDVSAATIDRLLRPIRETSGRGRRRRWGMGSAIKQSVPVRTFADWGDPPPGYCEADLVEHCGGVKHEGNFVHTLTLTDIHSGWTECAALVVREQTLVVEGISMIRRQLPFLLRGLDTDNVLKRQSRFGPGRDSVTACRAS